MTHHPPKNMKKLLTALLLSCATAHATESLDADAQSRRDFISKHVAKLAAGDSAQAVHITAAMQVNGNAVIALLCETADGRQTLTLWSHTLLAQNNTAPLAQHLAQLARGEDGKGDASARFNDSSNDYRNARTLGCYTAALNHALQNTDDAVARSEALLAPSTQAADHSDIATHLRAFASPPDAAPAAVAAFEQGWQADSAVQP